MTIERDPNVVERCFLVNLDRREDRLKEWLQQLPDPWPLPEPERFAAIDGRRCATPPQWRAGNGAWGCYRSHCLILEKCLIEGIDSYVVFEDDAGFVKDFADRFEQYANELPADWGLAYLGGQHLFAGKHPPQRVSEHVYRPYNVNRTHAFMVRGRENMKALYRHLHWNDWQQRHHIDHHLGRFIQRRYESLVQGKNVQRESIAVYTPDRWMVGQLPTKSNICGRKWNQTTVLQRRAKRRSLGRTVLCSAWTASFGYFLRGDGDASPWRPHGQSTGRLRSNRWRRSGWASTALRESDAIPSD